MRRLLATFSWQELRHHPWRALAATAAVMLGVALAFSVHLINASALDEFASAVRAVGGQPDLELRARQGGFDEALYARAAAHPQVALASPVVEVSTMASGRNGAATPLRVIGIDALVVAQIAPALMPQPRDDVGRFALFQPDAVFLNAAAAQALGDAGAMRIQQGGAWRTVQVAGRVSAPGEPLAVMDIGAAQALFGRAGSLTRIDLRLVPGTDRAGVARDFADVPQVVATGPGEAAERASNLSRAYRVNLTVLALVALFTGAFLVFSVLSLSVTQRARQFALLGVLGLTPRGRLQLVLGESLALGAAGSAAGIAMGTLLAFAALRLLGGDLGGGYFQGEAPALRFSIPAAMVYGALGVAAALAGGWWPARSAARLAPARALKGLGLGTSGEGTRSGVSGALLMAMGALLALAPPVAGLPVGAYISVALLLVGGIVGLPALVALLYRRPGALARRALPMLAIERARRMRGTASVAVGGVVASLALSVALTVMVASFRESVTRWLDAVLPADLYLRSASSAGANLGDAVFFAPAAADAVRRVPGVLRIAGQRNTQVLLRAGLPPVVLIARPLASADDAMPTLPLVDAPRAVPTNSVAVYVSEAVVDLYGLRPGDALPALAAALPLAAGQRMPQLVVAGVWRDYARQSGSIAIDLANWQRLTGDTRINDLAVWLAPGADGDAVSARIERALAQSASGPAPEIASARQIRTRSLGIFDRSFAVTYWLQAVAIGIGLFGVAASFSAQVLARRKEFGLLAHLGLTRAQVLAVVTGEGAAWTAVGAAAGLALGAAVSVVLVHVVNPQSFHWTMQLQWPALRLAALCAAVVAAGTGTAWIAGRSAAGRDAVLAVKEDW